MALELVSLKKRSLLLLILLFGFLASFSSSPQKDRTYMKFYHGYDITSNSFIGAYSWGIDEEKMKSICIMKNDTTPLTKPIHREPNYTIEYICRTVHGVLTYPIYEKIWLEENQLISETIVTNNQDFNIPQSVANNMTAEEFKAIIDSFKSS